MIAIGLALLALGYVLGRLDRAHVARRGATSEPSQPFARAQCIDTSRLAWAVRRESEGRRGT